MNCLLTRALGAERVAGGTTYIVATISEPGVITHMALGRLIFGALLGGAAVWFYRDQLKAYLDDKTRSARTRAADTLQAASENLQGSKETMEGGLGKERRIR